MKTNISPFWKQVFVSSGLSVNVIGHGCGIGYATILLHQLRSEDEHIEVTTEDASWIASILGIALIVGNLITPYIMERFGRKVAHLATLLPITCAWILFIYASSIPHLIVGRFLQGCSIGMMTPLCGVVIGEYCSPIYRAFLLISYSLGLASGVLIVHIIGTFLHWRYTSLICIIFSIISLIIILLSPETPSWLASKGRYDECRRVFKWLRGESEDQMQELDVMIKARKSEIAIEEKVNLKETIRKREFFIPILIMFHLYILFQFTGMNVLVAYAIYIINTLLGHDENAHTWLIGLDILRLLTTLLAAVILKIAKRRILLYSSGLLCILSLILISIYSYLMANGYIDGSYSYVIKGLILIYMLTLSIGMTPVPFAIAGEVFPVRYRSQGGCISSLMLSSMFFVSVKPAPALFERIGIHGTYLLFAAISAYCLLVLWFILPETKNKTLQEIENEFKGITDVEDVKTMEGLTSKLDDV